MRAARIYWEPAVSTDTDVPLNDDPALEQESDVLGGKASVAPLPVITFGGNKGFLSPQLRKWTTSTKRDYQKWFRFIKRLNRAAMKVLAAIEPDLNKNRELFAALLCRRALQTFQGSILLAERGMIADALTLVRSCAETAIALGCFAADDNYLERGCDKAENHRLTYGNVILGDKYLSAPLPRQEIGNIQKVVSKSTLQ
jgi:hypothetical protein